MIRCDGYNRASWFLAQCFSELRVEFVELHLDPDHLDVAFVLELAHVVDVAGKGKRLSLDYESHIEQSVEEGVLEEVADLVDQVPVPLLELCQDIVVPSLQDVKMSLRLAGTAEQRLKEDLILALAVDGLHHHISFRLGL